jgi:hypothetical protein
LSYFRFAIELPAKLLAVVARLSEGEEKPSLGKGLIETEPDEKPVMPVGKVLANSKAL